jgi:hypothetical protein
MRSRLLVPALVLGLGFGGLLTLSTSAADDKGDPATIDKLIKQLSSDVFAEREKAGQELERIGAPALEALRKAAQSEEADLKKRAEEILAKVEKKVESARILAPKRVHLKYKDTPLTEAVADFNKQSGYTIVLHDPEGKLKERKVTLDTGDVTFWQALDQFCQKAGLAEAKPEDLFRAVPGPGGRPLPPIRGGPAPATLPVVPADVPRKLPGLDAKPAEKKPAPREGGAEVGAAVAAPALAVTVLAQAPPPAAPATLPAFDGPVPPPPPGGFGGGGRAGVWGGSAPAPGQITLVDGKAKELPTDASSAVRIRALDRSDFFTPAGTGQALIPLEVTPEPKIQWQQTVGVNVEKAVDDQGQKLTKVMEEDNVGGVALPGGGLARPGLVIRRGPPVLAGAGAFHQQVPVRLKKGEKEAKTLKELTGTITAQVLPPPERFLTVVNVMKAAGKTIKGEEGGSITIQDVKKAEDGTITITFEMDPPANIIPAGGSPLPSGPAGPGRFREFPAPAPPGATIPAVPIRPAPPKKEGGAPGRGAFFGAPAPAAPPPAIEIVQEVGPAPGKGVVVLNFAVAAPVPIDGGPAPVNFGLNQGISLLDEKGNALPANVHANYKRDGAKLVRQYVAMLPAQKDAKEPAKLVFEGRRTVTIDVPFTLKNVPLP